MSSGGWYDDMDMRIRTLRAMTEKANREREEWELNQDAQVASPDEEGEYEDTLPRVLNDAEWEARQKVKSTVESMRDESIRTRVFSREQVEELENSLDQWETSVRALPLVTINDTNVYIGQEHTNPLPVVRDCGCACRLCQRDVHPCNPICACSCPVNGFLMDERTSDVVVITIPAREIPEAMQRAESSQRLAEMYGTNRTPEIDQEWRDTVRNSVSRIYSDRGRPVPETMAELLGMSTQDIDEQAAWDRLVAHNPWVAEQFSRDEYSQIYRFMHNQTSGNPND